MAVPLAPDKSGRALEVHNAVPLFRTNLVTTGAPNVLTIAAGLKQQYAVAPDARFLMVVPSGNQRRQRRSPSSSNWPATVRR
jgi:hypothetical protein